MSDISVKKVLWVIGIAAFFLLIFSLFNSSSNSGTTTNDRSATPIVDSTTSSNENIELNQAEEDVNINSDPPLFNGYPCTVDCSGHEAGYKWAEERGITQDDVDNYSGNSNSFMEGMQSYVDDNE
ncbi:MAG: hypothetical protein G01um10145_447 [Microgenomates group bacterium Gr01-1014_5]|nr:MAG: hypothetical protein G01um10145_447 [Microgenomates group bacterium Gr01-1014_5]